MQKKQDKQDKLMISSVTPKLIELLDKASPIGDVEISINDVNTHEIKMVTLKVKRLQSIDIPPSSRIKRANKDKNYKPIKVNVVMVYNETYCWILITNLPTESLNDCLEVTKIYKERWHVEDFHKVLKTGYQVDELYLHASLSAIKNALVMASISACCQEKLKANWKRPRSRARIRSWFVQTPDLKNVTTKWNRP